MHIPFCRHRCHYCDFHFSVSQRYRPQLLSALRRELELTSHYFTHRRLSTLYFGGGTPSILSLSEWESLFDAIRTIYSIDDLKECTVECNPEDITAELLELWHAHGVDRISLGVQSFCNEDLRYLGRRHDARQIHRALDAILSSDIPKISIDLIYGIPTMTMDGLVENLRMVEQYDIPHFSAYALTVERRTALYHFIQKGKYPPPDDSVIVEQMKLLMDWAQHTGYRQYEISNFAKPGYESQHNLVYWHQQPYLGVGPSAHSYDGHRRRHHVVASNLAYIRSLRSGVLPHRVEYLSDEDLYNELILTRLRLEEGIPKERLLGFPSAMVDHFCDSIEPFVQKGWVSETPTAWRLTAHGKPWADAIAREVFYLQS